jgi:hypothetical protein
MLIYEDPRIGDVLLWQSGEEVNYVITTVTVEAGIPASTIGQVLGMQTSSGQYTQLTPGASDGTQNVAGILLEMITLPLGSVSPLSTNQYNVLTRGPAVVKSTGLVYTAGMTSGQIATVATQLLALGIKIETAFGV